MMHQYIDPLLVLVLLLNFAILSATRLRFLVYAVAAQGVLLWIVYPFAHSGGDATSPGDEGDTALTFARLIAFALVMLGTKGVLIPYVLFRAMRQADARWSIE